ncbi:MAG: LptF/LptG family permease [Bacteroidetes bacterium]|nr:LptF/LptG family permease [Bacteroidota bacterium]
MLKILDIYILKRFMGTFLFSIALMLSIFIVFDISEKLQDFIAEKVPLKEIILEHYLNFIPYYGNLFSPLFTFISVILFTSRMASRTEFVAMLSSGTSFTRILRPYMIGAAIITFGSLFLNHFIIPRANKVRIAFEDRYINNGYSTEERNIHKQIAPGTFLYLESYDNRVNTGYRISLEKVVNNRQTYMLKAETMKWDSIKSLWMLSDFFERTLVEADTITGGLTKPFYKETHKFGASRPLKIDFSPKDMWRFESKIEVMPYFELKEYIAKERMKGSSRIEFFEVEMYKRTAFPFATFILTIIGVSIASRKIRGGVGLHIAAGLVLSMAYILFMHISTTFATSGMMSPIIAVWIPNLIFAPVAFYLYKNAQQ